MDSRSRVSRPSVAWLAVATFAAAVGCAGSPKTAAAPTPTPVADRPAVTPIALAAKPEPEVAAKIEPEPEPEPAVAPVRCDSGEEYGPLALSAEEAATRHGEGARALAQLSSSKAQPVEVCGVQGERRFLLEATCADGSRPFATGRGVAQARVGSIGPGGRCDKIIDLYAVACPGKTYEVYMDMYFCGPGEEFP